MDAQAFSEILRQRDKLFKISWEALKSLSQQYPYSPHLWLLMLEKARLEQRPDYQVLLEQLAARTFDRPFLYRYLKHVQLTAESYNHYQIAEDYLELLDLNELDKSLHDDEASPQKNSDVLQQMAISPPDYPVDEGERFSSLEEVFNFPPQSQLLQSTSPDDHNQAEQTTSANETALEHTTDPLSEEKKHVLSLDELLAELPETIGGEKAEKSNRTSSPSSQEADILPPAPTNSAHPQATLPQDFTPYNWALHGQLAAAAVATAQRIWQWLQLQQPTPDVPPQKPHRTTPSPYVAPLKRHELSSWQQLIRAQPRHLFIAPDSPVEHPPIRHASDKKKKKKKTSEPEYIAQRSLETPKDVVSEPLARVLEQQGHYEQAITMYERLCLKYPEKSDFFARKIEALKKKL